MTERPDNVIVINGEQITAPEVATLLCALLSFASQFPHPDSLGTDDHGRTMVKLYTRNVNQTIARLTNP